MEIEISIGNRQVMIILMLVTIASAIGIALAAVPNPGHSWTEVECADCITSSNLADNSVTGAKIQDGTITNADIASTGLNADTLDGKHANELGTACGWTGWSAAGCTGGTCYSTVKMVQLYCQNGKITQAQVVDACTYCY